MRRALCVAAVVCAAATARAQSPELALREFASGQIKKGVRAIGFGGDGATWGNYGLVWREAGGALLDGGMTAYPGGNDFSFAAVGFTSPPLWRDLVVYAIALSQTASGVHLALNAPRLGTRAMVGDGGNQAVFVKVAMPLPHHFSIGVLLSYEVSHFDAVAVDEPAAFLRYQTRWRPSGGFGVAWQPIERLLVGVRAILNHDEERRLAPLAVDEGLARSYELRAGASFSPWRGALLDAGVTVLERANAIAGTDAWKVRPNVGFEQAFLERHLVVRAGLDEESPGAGFSVRWPPLSLDVAYIYNLGSARVGTLFGDRSSSVLATLTLDYRALMKK